MRYSKKVPFPYLFVFSVCFLIHAALAIHLKMLNFSSDEFGVLAIAAKWAGEDWSNAVSQISYYGWGQAILYVPIFLLIKNPVLRYICVGILNSFLVSLIPIIILNIGTEYLNIKERAAICLSLITGIFPSYTIYSKWAWNETLLCLLPWLILHTILKLSNIHNSTEKRYYSLFLSFLLAWGYAAHGRALGFFIATAIVLLFVVLGWRKNIVNIQFFCCGLLIFLFLQNGIRNYLYTDLWLIKPGQKLNNTLSGNVENLLHFCNPRFFSDDFRIIWGQFYSAILSSYGTLLALIMIICIQAIKYIRNREYMRALNANMPKYVLFVYCFSVFFCSYLISIIFLSPYASDVTSRGDYFIYTRYFSNTLGLLFFAVAYYFYSHKLPDHFLVVWLNLLAFVLLSGSYISNWVNQREHISNVAIANLIPYLGKNPTNNISYANFNSLNFWILSIISLAIILFIKKNWYYMFSLWIIIFLHAYIDVGNNICLKSSFQNLEQVKVMMDYFDVHTLSDVSEYVYYYDARSIKRYSFEKFQFALPEYKLANISSDSIDVIAEGMPQNSFIISTEDLWLEQYNKDYFRVYDDKLNKNSEYLWVYGADSAEKMDAKSISVGKNSSQIFELETFSTKIGIINEEGISSQASTGYLLYGPYTHLKKGNYILFLEGAASSLHGTISVDIVSDRGQTVVLAKTIIIPSTENTQMNKNKISTSLMFSATDNIDDLEIRVYLEDCDKVSISKIYVTLQ